MILSDILFFAKHSAVIADSYLVKPNAVFVIASVTYGAVIEEVMLRLFWMSLAAFVLHFLFERKKDTVSVWILICANIVTSLLFAAGHLPATFAMLGSSPLIIFRCFLLNGGLGLVFGWLYRKHGLHYAMIAHGICHVVSKLIWILFI
nr:CPBP family intramembrane metalloprotease [Clostridia bacterium]